MGARGSKPAARKAGYDPLPAAAVEDKPPAAAVDFAALHARAAVRAAEAQRVRDLRRAENAAAAAAEYARQVDAAVAEVLAAVDAAALERDGAWAYHFLVVRTTTTVGAYSWTPAQMLVNKWYGRGAPLADDASFTSKLEAAVRPFKVLVSGGRVAIQV